MKKICFFGGSVTEQTTGYANCISINIINEYNVTILGFGSHGLNNAGILFIDDIVKQKPDLCVIQFFSNGSKQVIEDIDCISVIANKLITIKCIPIFFFNLCRGSNYSGDEYISGIKNYLNDNGLLHIDMNDHIKPLCISSVAQSSLSSVESSLNITSHQFDGVLNVKRCNVNSEYKWEHLIKDDVHTTDEGAKIYSDILTDFIKKTLDDANYIFPTIKVRDTSLYNITTHSLNKTITKTLNIVFDENISSLYITLEVGHHSGIININGREYNTWDKWCYFSRRRTFHFPLNDKNITIHLLSKSFDTSECKDKYINFVEQQKQLCIKSISYSSNSTLQQIDYI